jgi:hypothetical protein
MLAGGLTILGLALFLATNKASSWPKRAIGFIFFAPVAFALLGMGGMRAWVASGGPPEAKAFTVARGVRYERNARVLPEPLVWHVATVDLTAPGLSLMVTPGDPTRLLPSSARTPTKAALEFQADIALAGGFVEPALPLDIYAPPPPDGAAMRPLGFSASKGVAYGLKTGPTFSVSDTNVATIGDAPAAAHNAISGDCIVLINGKPTDGVGCARPLEALARGAIGLDLTRKVLYLVSVDGGRPSRSRGVTVAGLADLLAAMGAETALEVAVGPSVAMAGRNEQAKQVLFSSPVSGGIVDVETPVANHLMVMGDQRPTTAY